MGFVISRPDSTHCQFCVVIDIEHLLRRPLLRASLLDPFAVEPEVKLLACCVQVCLWRPPMRPDFARSVPKRRGMSKDLPSRFRSAFPVRYESRSRSPIRPAFSLLRIWYLIGYPRVTFRRVGSNHLDPPDTSSLASRDPVEAQGLAQRPNPVRRIAPRCESEAEAPASRGAISKVPPSAACLKRGHDLSNAPRCRFLVIC